MPNCSLLQPCCKCGERSAYAYSRPNYPNSFQYSCTNCATRRRHLSRHTKKPKSVGAAVAEPKRTRADRHGKFLGLTKYDFPPVYRERFQHVDYLDKLSVEEREWLARFLDGETQGRFYEDGWGPQFTPTQKKQIWRETYYARRDYYNLRQYGVNPKDVSKSTPRSAALKNKMKSK